MNVVSGTFISSDDNLDLELLDFKLSNITDLMPMLGKLRGQTVVIKCGGKHIAEREAMLSMCKDISIMMHFGAKVILVHGGGSQMGEMLEKFGAKNELVDSHRVTDAKVLEVAQMVLCGRIAPNLVDNLAKSGICGVAISGKDANLIVASKLRRVKRDFGSNIERILDLGMVGEPFSLNADFLNAILDAKMVPVISPVGISNSGSSYILNADSVASFVAYNMDADKLILLSDEEGIFDAEGSLLTAVSSEVVKAMMSSGMLSEDLAFKAECAINAVKNNVRSVYIYNGTKKHAVLLDLFNYQAEGTMIYDVDRNIDF